jgi:hypothetical protein
LQAELDDKTKKEQEKARKKQIRAEEFGRKMLSSCATFIQQGHHPINALLLAGADELSTEDEVVKLCNALVTYKHPHPFEDVDDIPIEGKYLIFLREVRFRGYTFNDSMEVINFARDIRDESLRSLFGKIEAQRIIDSITPAPKPPILSLDDREATTSD